ncbi:MAG: TetR/AcrR family transcriptional regulator C-terminal domain-containing protein [Acidimicrobiales bacterium]
MAPEAPNRSTGPARPPRLNRERVLRAAVAMADRDGLAALSMRHLADDLGVVPMALYKHVANKEALVDGMVDLVIDEIDHPDPTGVPWKAAVRAQVLAARSAMLRHPWARAAIETRAARSPTVLTHLDAVASRFVAGGLSPDLVHHGMHAIGSRVWGFTQDVFDDGVANADAIDPDALEVLRARFPGLAVVADAVRHDESSVVGSGCDDQAEFEFALDLLLDGIEQRHEQGWSPHPRAAPRRRRSR